MARSLSSGRQWSSTRRNAVLRSGTTFCAPTTQIAWRDPPAYPGSWLPLAEAITRDPVSVTAWTLPTMTSGLASSRQISVSWVARSMAWPRALMASYRPLALMSSSMPDTRSVSLAPVNTLAPSGMSSWTRARAAAASSRISTVKLCSRRAAAARSRLCVDAGSANEVVGVLMVSPGSLDDGFVSVVRPGSARECEAASHFGALPCRIREGSYNRGSQRHHDHRRPARPGPGRDHQRAALADQSRLPAARLHGRGRGRRPRDLCPLVHHVRPAAGSDRIPRGLADHGGQPHLPQPARLGPRPARDLRGRVDPRAAAGRDGVDHRTFGRHHR